MLCKELQFGDWCCNEHRTPMRITNVGVDYAYAICEEHERYALAFSDVEGFNPQPIEITAELLKANGCEVRSYYSSFHNLGDYYFMKDANGNHLELKQGMLAIWNEYEPDNDGVYSDILVPCKYVHQLQRALRLAGLTDMANNFKV